MLEMFCLMDCEALGSSPLTIHSILTLKRRAQARMKFAFGSLLRPDSSLPTYCFDVPAIFANSGWFKPAPSLSSFSRSPIMSIILYRAG